ncbi:MAG TPA: hypothetical protein VJJ47_01610 [Candidatus Paceibacterota bacterium]
MGRSLKKQPRYSFCYRPGIHLETPENPEGVTTLDEIGVPAIVCEALGALRVASESWRKSAEVEIRPETRLALREFRDAIDAATPDGIREACRSILPPTVDEVLARLIAGEMTARSGRWQNGRYPFVAEVRSA